MIGFVLYAGRVRRFHWLPGARVFTEMGLFASPTACYWRVPTADWLADF